MNRQYLPDLERARAAREKTLQDAKTDSINRMMSDLEVDRAKHPEAAAQDRWDPEEEEDDDDPDINIIDRSKTSHVFSKRALILVQAKNAGPGNISMLLGHSDMAMKVSIGQGPVKEQKASKGRPIPG